MALTEATGSFATGMQLINAEAQHLQAYDVVAKMPNGLPAPGQVVSAYDEALIARQALASPAFMGYDSTLSAPFQIKPGKSETLLNQNTLLTQYKGGIGGKIGWTQASGATYIGMARRNGVTLIVTVLHCTAAAGDHRRREAAELGLRRGRPGRARSARWSARCPPPPPCTRPPWPAPGPPPGSRRPSSPARPRPAPARPTWAWPSAAASPS